VYNGVICRCHSLVLYAKVSDTGDGESRQPERIETAELSSHRRTAENEQHDNEVQLKGADGRLHSFIASAPGRVTTLKA
jgi:hypothetical protein